jgi:hypothetical protein
MSDVFEHNPGDHEDPLTGPTWIIGFIGAVLLVVIMLGLTALYYNASYEEELEKVIQRDPQELENLRTAQLARITASPRYVEQQIVIEGQDPKTDRSLVIPIDRAMELVVQEANRGQQ